MAKKRHQQINGPGTKKTYEFVQLIETGTSLGGLMLSLATLGWENK